MRPLAAVLALVLSSAARAQLVGVVVGVTDGDTLSVRIDEQVLNVDLRRVDAPEVGQPFGAEARDSLAALCEAKTITLEELGVDRKRRVFGEIDCEGVDAGEEQVKRGLAWTKPREADTALRELQAKARAQSKGLWSEASPVPPWEWSAMFKR